jgi:hypothetical protein
LKVEGDGPMPEEPVQSDFKTLKVNSDNRDEEAKLVTEALDFHRLLFIVRFRFTANGAEAPEESFGGDRKTWAIDHPDVIGRMQPHVFAPGIRFGSFHGI